MNNSGKHLSTIHIKASQSCILKGMSHEIEFATLRGAYGEIKHN
jgi:hypothetical protein